MQECTGFRPVAEDLDRPVHRIAVLQVGASSLLASDLHSRSASTTKRQACLMGLIVVSARLACNLCVCKAPVGCQSASATRFAGSGPVPSLENFLTKLYTVLNAALGSWARSALARCLD